MPDDIIDYSNTVFYKIFCNDATVNDLYVGHTTNFEQRKSDHMRGCIKDNSPNHHLKVYKFIRANGGWDNWRMDIIGSKDCADHYEARKIEQTYFEKFGATLNSIEPLPVDNENTNNNENTNDKNPVLQLIEKNNELIHLFKQQLVTMRDQSETTLDQSETILDLSESILEIYTRNNTTILEIIQY